MKQKSIITPLLLIIIHFLELIWNNFAEILQILREICKSLLNAMFQRHSLKFNQNMKDKKKFFFCEM